MLRFLKNREIKEKSEGKWSINVKIFHKSMKIKENLIEIGPSMLRFFEISKINIDGRHYTNNYSFKLLKLVCSKLKINHHAKN